MAKRRVVDAPEPSSVVTIPRWFLRYYPHLWSALVGEPDDSAVRAWGDGSDSNSLRGGMSREEFRHLWRGVRGWELYHEARRQFAEEHDFDPDTAWVKWNARPDQSRGDLARRFARAYGLDPRELSDAAGSLR